jgi:hypothetical protein
MTRHNFALARLLALVMKLGTASAPPLSVDRVILANDRHQSAAENYTAAAGYLALVACFLAAFIPLFAAVPLALVVIEIPIYAFALPFGNRRLTSIGYMLCGAAMAWYLVLQPKWFRFAGYTFFAVIALNAIAFAILWLLRKCVK